MPPELKLFVEPLSYVANKAIAEHLAQRTEESWIDGIDCADGENRRLVCVDMRDFLFFAYQYVTHKLEYRFFASVDCKAPVELSFIEGGAPSPVGETAVCKLLTHNLLSSGETRQVIVNAVKPWHQCGRKSPQQAFARPPSKFTPTHRRTH